MQKKRPPIFTSSSFNKIQNNLMIHLLTKKTAGPLFVFPGLLSIVSVIWAEQDPNTDYRGAGFLNIQT